MTHKEHAIEIVSTFVVGLLMSDEESRSDFEHMVGDYLDWYSHSDEDKESIYKEVVELVGDFSEPLK